MESETSIQLAHGGGGRLTRDLIDAEIVSRFGDGPLAGLPDAATLAFPDDGLVFTPDSFVVQPLEFPGGNIGNLAVHRSGFVRGNKDLKGGQLLFEQVELV